MKRIVITIGQLNIGGAERRLLQLVRSVHALGLPVEVTVFVVSGMAGTFDDDFRAAGAVIVYGHPGQRGLADLWRLCREKRPDVLHINAETAAGFYGLAGLLAGVPYRVAHFRSMSTPKGFPASLKAFAYEAATNLFCHRIIGVSSGSRQGRLVVRPWETIFNGITPPTDDALAAMPLPGGFTEDVNVAVLGRIQRAKNVPRAIRVFAEFRKLVPSAVLHIIGPYVDVDRKEIEAIAHAAGVGDRVICHGPVSNPFQYLSHASLLLLTSTVEGLPGAVIEALACGTPVVATDLPGTRDIEAVTVGVRRMQLSDGDGPWAAAMVDAVGFSRVAIRAAFQRGPFSNERYVNDILKVWNDGG